METGKSTAGDEQHSWIVLFWGACKYVWPEDPWLQVRACSMKSTSCSSAHRLLVQAFGILFDEAHLTFKSLMAPGVSIWTHVQ
eukprot:873480-Pelagomonas_calceolata.AAC.5